MFLGQPLATRLGTALGRDLDEPRWTQFEIGVAWVRTSGTKHLDARVKEFLQRGGRLLATVGVDFEHTTVEGLEVMLRWETAGAAETYVFHDEGSSTFHPKVYLFTGGEAARLYVGSSNLTEAGLYNNQEASVRIDGSTDGPVIADASAALRFWREESELVKRLDAGFLAKLEVNGYVLREAEAARRERDVRLQRANVTKQRKRLFGSAGNTAPPVRTRRSPEPTLATTGQALLMRVRTSRGGVQVQIPKALRTSGFLGGASDIVSAETGVRRAIITANARGTVNTFKFDAPEVNGMKEPFLRLHWDGDDLIYEAFDVSSAGGAQIKAQLLAGFEAGQSRSTRSDRTTATWWLLI